MQTEPTENINTLIPTLLELETRNREAFEVMCHVIEAFAAGNAGEPLPAHESAELVRRHRALRPDSPAWQARGDELETMLALTGGAS